MSDEICVLSPSQGCRYCDNQTFLTDTTGPLHPCCKFWIEEMGMNYCTACRSSEALRKQDRSRGQYRG